MRVLSAALLCLAVSACTTLADRTSATLNAPGLEGTRWGLVVMTMEGKELIAIRPDERFLPASNTKLFTVAAAFNRLGDLTQADPTLGTSLRMVPRGDGAPDLVLVGGGDAMLIDAEDCERDCLSSLADAVASARITRVNNIIGDDRLFPDQPWGLGWSWEDLITRSGAAVSALTVNSNEVALIIKPGAAVGAPAEVTWRDGDKLDGEYFYKLQNEVVTVDTDEDIEDQLFAERLQDSSTVRLYGRVALKAQARGLPVAVSSPAGAAAQRLRRLLEARGVVVDGAVVASHRPVSASDYPDVRKEGSAPSTPSEGIEIARLVPPPLIVDATFLMKQSQNLHAELLIRRLGLVEGAGSVEDGLAIVGEMLTQAGAPRKAWDFSDGSGMSIYNRVTPRMVANFLRWTSQQPWGSAFRETLPIGGADGTLRRRFTNTSLQGRIFAKTGTLNGVTALSGFLQTASGKTLIFSAYANDRPSEAPPAIAALDGALVDIAAAN